MDIDDTREGGVKKLGKLADMILACSLLVNLTN